MEPVVVLFELADCQPHARVSYCVPGVRVTGLVATVVVVAVWVMVLQLLVIFCHVPLDR